MNIKHKLVNVAKIKSYEPADDPKMPYGGFEAYVSVFNNVDNHKEAVKPGAYAKSLNKFLAEGFIAAQHDWKGLPIGWPIEAKEDSYGLLVKMAFGRSQKAQEYREYLQDQIEAGRTVKMSIGYLVKDAERMKGGFIQLKELDLFEASIVNLAANDMATVVGVKSDDPHLEDEGASWSYAVSNDELREMSRKDGNVLMEAEPLEPLAFVENHIDAVGLVKSVMTGQPISKQATATVAITKEFAQRLKKTQVDYYKMLKKDSARQLSLEDVSLLANLSNTLWEIQSMVSEIIMVATSRASAGVSADAMSFVEQRLDEIEEVADVLAKLSEAAEAARDANDPLIEGGGGEKSKTPEEAKVKSQDPQATPEVTAPVTKELDLENAALKSAVDEAYLEALLAEANSLLRV